MAVEQTQALEPTDSLPDNLRYLQPFLDLQSILDDNMPYLRTTELTGLIKLVDFILLGAQQEGLRQAGKLPEEDELFADQSWNSFTQIATIGFLQEQGYDVSGLTGAQILYAKNLRTWLEQLSTTSADNGAADTNKAFHGLSAFSQRFREFIQQQPDHSPPKTH